MLNPRPSYRANRARRSEDKSAATGQHYLFARPRVSAAPGLSRYDFERAETYYMNLFAFEELFFYQVKQQVYKTKSFSVGQAAMILIDDSCEVRLGHFVLVPGFGSEARGLTSTAHLATSSSVFRLPYVIHFDRACQWI